MRGVKSETFSNSVFCFTLKVTKERSLQSSVTVSSDKITSTPKKILSANKNCKETSRWDFVSLTSHTVNLEIFFQSWGLFLQLELTKVCWLEEVVHCNSKTFEKYTKVQQNFQSLLLI